MVDIATITGTLTAAIATLKEIAKVAEKTRDKELNQRVLELQQCLMAANTQSDREVYWWNRGGRKDGPYCKVCWHSDGRTIQLMATGEKGLYQCVKCKGSFLSSEHGQSDPDSGFWGPTGQSWQEL